MERHCRATRDEGRDREASGTDKGEGQEREERASFCLALHRNRGDLEFLRIQPRIDGCDLGWMVRKRRASVYGAIVTAYTNG